MANSLSNYLSTLCHGISCLLSRLYYSLQSCAWVLLEQLKQLVASAVP